MFTTPYHPLLRHDVAFWSLTVRSPPGIKSLNASSPKLDHHLVLLINNRALGNV